MKYTGRKIFPHDRGLPDSETENGVKRRLKNLIKTAARNETVIQWSIVVKLWGVNGRDLQIDL